MKKLIPALAIAMTTVACTDNGAAPTQDSMLDEKAASVWKLASECIKSKCTPARMDIELETDPSGFVDSVFSFICQETYINSWNFEISYHIDFRKSGKTGTFYGNLYSLPENFFPECR